MRVCGWVMNNIRLNTKRLHLRPIRKEDAGLIFNYRSDPVTNKYQGWIPESVKDVIDFIETRVSPVPDIKDTWFQLVILKKDTGELIGDAGLHFFDHDNKQVEIGCTIDKKYHKLGFATEAMSEIMKFLFIRLKKHRIIGSIDPRNIGSINLVKKLGLRQEAHFRESILQNGEWVDDLIFAILEKEWNKNDL